MIFIQLHQIQVSLTQLQHCKQQITVNTLIYQQSAIQCYMEWFTYLRIIIFSESTIKMLGNQNKSIGGNFLSNMQQAPQNNVFGQPGANNTFGNKTNTGLGIFNTNTTQNTNQPNMFTNTAQQPQTNSFFTQPQPQQQQQPQGLGLGLLNRAPTTNTLGLFNQTQNTTPQVGTGFLNQAPSTTNPASFMNQGNTTPQVGAGFLNQPPATTTLGSFLNQGNTPFNQPNQTQPTGFLGNTAMQPTNIPQLPLMTSYQTFPNVPLSEAHMQHIRNAPIEQRKQFIQMFHREQIRNMIEYFRKPIEFLKNERLQLTPDNPLRSEKITEVANALNMKPQVVHVQREVKKNLTDRIKKLNEEKQKLDSLSNEFAKNVFPKLRKYKQQLLIAIGRSKMAEQVQKDMDELENQMKDFFRPMFNAQQNKFCQSFVDPNRFCVRVTEKLFKNMISLNNLMDDILVCHSQNMEEEVNPGDVILQLIEYYENVAVALKDYTSKYNELKKRLIKRGRSKNASQILRKIGDTAMSQMKKDMQPYELVKEIECLLEKREQKLIEEEH